MLIALLVCLIPTTIGGLLSAIGIAGMDRLVRHNVLAMSGRAVEAAGDVDTLLLDKTGTITLGNRQAAEFIPMPGVTEAELADAAQLASLADETPEGRSIVVLAKSFGIRGRHIDPEKATFIEFSAQTRMSGIDVDGHSIRKGAGEAVIAWIRQRGGAVPAELERSIEQVSLQGGTPLAVARDDQALGVIHLKDIVKGGIRERFDELRAMGIRTVMITGDNPLTAAVIAKEAGVDDFLAEATPEAKMELIRSEQQQGKLVAMTGDGTNDAPALAQADVGRGHELRHLGRQRGRQHGRPRLQPHQAHRDRGDRQAAADHARRAHHLQHRQRRGQVLRHHPGDVHGGLPRAAQPQRHAPALAAQRRALGGDLQRPDHRGLLIPLALRGVKYRPIGAAALLRYNLLVYGLGGVIAPFIGIKLIDLILVALHLTT